MQLLAFGQVSAHLHPSPSPGVKKLLSAVDCATALTPSCTTIRNKDTNHIHVSATYSLRWAAFATAQKITSQQSPHHSRPRSLLELPLEPEKRAWRNKTAIEKQQHAECYPNYRLSVNRVTNGSGTMSAGCETPRATRGTGNV